MKFVVVGGVYTDTSFTKLESKEERYGPFSSYADAIAKWRSAMGWQLDTCCHRLVIEQL